MTPADQHALREALARVGQSGKFMPIMLSDEMKLRVRRGERFVHVRNVPWELFGDPCEQISQQNHGQSLARIAERGGFDAPEAVCILTGVHWRDGRVSEDQAHRILYAMTAFYRRGALAAEAENTRLKETVEGARKAHFESLREARRGFSEIHDGLADYTRPKQSSGEVCAYWRDRFAEEVERHTVLATISPKEHPDA